MKKWFLRWGPIIIALFGVFYPFSKDLAVWFNEAHMTYEQIGFKIFTILSICYIVFSISYFLWKLRKNISELDRFNNNLEKWIGLFSFQDDKGSYVDLKGKIKRYIQEELEKESTERKSVDTQIANTLADQIASIRIRIKDIPMKAISDDKLPIK
jgi:hypothetical protein